MNKIILFESQKIRRIWHNEEWYFSVIDVVWVLSESVNTTDYLKKLRKRDLEFWNYIGTNCPQVEMIGETWKKRKTLAWNIEQLFRIIQSIPSPKAEPFKRWLSKVWYERVQEIENPELAQDRIKELYEKKWYSKDWIDKRLRGIVIRQDLTNEWKDRWITNNKDFAILTAEISKATFWMTPSEYKKFKNIPEKSKANLRDNMTDLELIFTMLWEKVTTEISKTEKPKSFTDNKKVANRWWKVAWNARKETEKEIWKSVISEKNYLKDWDKKKLK